tara:strand:+ start:1928 stop:3097 length:1170 start_codon:yes stop_codon:yes gene_type:complete
MKKPFYKIGSIVKEAALQQKGYLDPNRGEGPDFKTYTDPTTGKKAGIEYEKGNLGRTYKDAYAKRDMKTYGKMGLKEYTDFSKKQKAHYRTTGVWLSPDQMKAYKAKDTKGRGTNNKPEIIKSSGGNGNNNTTNVNNNNTTDLITKNVVTDPNKSKDTNGKDTEGGPKGLVRAYVPQKGFSGDVLDKDIADKTTDAQSIRRYARGLKSQAMGAGATRREAKHHKTLAKALAYAQDAGMTLKETDAKGGVVNESIGEKSKSSIKGKDGKARKKAMKLMKRANRLAHRMKDYEGHNIRKGDVGSQYYGDKQKYNQVTPGDQRNAQLRAGAGSGISTIKNNLSTNNGNPIGSNATGLAGTGGGTVKYKDNVGKVEIGLAATRDITGTKKNRM